MNPTIRESCVRAGNTGFIFIHTFILFVLCGTVNLLNASDAQPAPSDSVAELVNVVNELQIRIANLEARFEQYERIESIPIPKFPHASHASHTEEQFAGMHLAKENAWRKYRWTDPAQWAQIEKGISLSAVIDADKLTLAHNSALSHDLALILEYSMEDSKYNNDEDIFAVELLYAF